MNESRQNAATNKKSDLWFDDLQVVDPEWVELSVKTSTGNHVRYRIPRRTLFEKVDQAAR